MSLDRREASYIYSLLGEGDASAAIRRLELLQIVPIPAFGQGLLTPLLFAVERQSQPEQIETLRTFLDRLTAELTEDEGHALHRSEWSDESPHRFFELHEQFFERWRDTLQDAEAQAEGNAAPEVLASLSGALATIWRPTLYDGWETNGPALPVWGTAVEVLQPILMTIAEGPSPATRAEELDAFAACILGLYQGGDSQQRVLANLSERFWEEGPERRAVRLWRAAVSSPAPVMNTARFMLGNALVGWYHESGQVAALDEAIGVLRQAVAATPPDARDWVRRQSSLGMALRTRFDRTGESADLEQAIGVLENVGEPAPTVVEEERRYVNVAVTTLAGRLAPSSRSLQPGGRYRLRLDIGPLSRESIVINAREHPFIGLPPSEDGHWLELVVTSTDFQVAPRRRHFFLPTRGVSWRCRCRPGGSHRCSAEERQRFLTVPLRAPWQAGMATLRLGIYFRKNLVHSQLLTAAVGVPPLMSMPAALTSTIDYSLSAGFTGLDRLPHQSFNIMLNDNGDGQHRIVVNGRRGPPLAFTQGDDAIAVAAKAARECLFQAHLEQPEGESAPTGRLRRRLRLRRAGKQPGRRDRRAGGGLSPAEWVNKYRSDGSKNAEEFLADLRTLATLGWTLLAAVFPDPKDLTRLLSIMREQAAATRGPMTIQVSRAANSTMMYPWQLVYDIPPHPDEWPPTWEGLCPALETWLATGGPEPGTSSCPAAKSAHKEGAHEPGTLCLFGFWGFAAILELPPPQGQSRTLAVSICDDPVVPARVVALGKDLPFPDVATAHLQAINCPPETPDVCRSRGALERRLAASDFDLVYFYCHGSYAPCGGSILMPVLIVGSDQISPSLITAWALGWHGEDQQHWTTRRPLVVLNGCHTTEILPKDLMNFVSTFIGAGASGVIGTEISIDQRVASLAMSCFLELFERGQPVGPALRSMRWKLLTLGNVMGLSYTPYCSASLRLQLRQQHPFTGSSAS